MKKTTVLKAMPKAVSPGLLSCVTVAPCMPSQLTPATAGNWVRSDKRSPGLCLPQCLACCVGRARIWQVYLNQCPIPGV